MYIGKDCWQIFTFVHLPGPAIEEYLHEVIRVMGSARRTSASELDRAGQLLLGEFYRGAFARGAEPPPDGTRHVVIVNTTGPPGEHWMCLYRDPTSTWVPGICDKRLNNE